MVGTETDEESLLIAKDNVFKNNLQHLIECKCYFNFHKAILNK